MRRGFTLIELLIVTAIIAIIAAIAIPNLKGMRDGFHVRPGVTAMWNGHTVRVVMQAVDADGFRRGWVVRIDHGPGKLPRYEQVTVQGSELRPTAEAP